MANLAAPMPSFATPFLKDGLVNEPWYRYLFQLQLRTGGAGQIPDINALQAQADYNTAHVDYQSVVPRDPATLASICGIEDLWGQQRALDDISWLRNRIAEIESVLPPAQDATQILKRIAELEAFLFDIRLQPLAFVEQWTAPTLLNSWVNFGGGFNPAGYYKDPFGIVHLRGTVKSGTIGLIAFTLPAGYRPANTEIFAVTSNNAFGRVTIASNGDVNPDVGSNVYVCFDGITLRAA